MNDGWERKSHAVRRVQLDAERTVQGFGEPPTSCIGISKTIFRCPACLRYGTSYNCVSVLFGDVMTGLSLNPYTRFTSLDFLVFAFDQPYKFGAFVSE